MTVLQEKKRLRAELRAAEQAIVPQGLAQLSARLCGRLCELPEYQTAQTVFCFVGTPREVDTRPFLRRALADGKRVCAPRCIAPGVMELRQLAALDELATGAYGICEPRAGAPLIQAREVDLAVVPCLSCTPSGVRLGRGGGYYDRFLSVYPHAAVVVCPDQLLRDALPTEPHDQPLRVVLTERRLYRDGVIATGSARSPAQR